MDRELKDIAGPKRGACPPLGRAVPPAKQSSQEKLFKSIDYPSLLKKPILPTFITYEVEVLLSRIDILCWDCHDKELSEVERSTRATRFRNGERNLHYVHVRKFERAGGPGGECLRCHDVHYSGQASLMKSTVPFDAAKWKLDIDFAPHENGCTCTVGCHKQTVYSR